MLRPLFGTVLTAADAGTALTRMQQNEVGVIVCEPRDAQLADFLIGARENYPATVRVILTGYPNLNSVIRSVNLAHPYKFLSKPWQDEELCAAVQLACEEHARLSTSERQLSDYRSIRAHAERAHALHALAALLHAIGPDIDRQALAGLPIGTVLVQEQTVMLVNPVAQDLLATLGLAVPAPGSAQAGLPDELAALLDTPQRAHLHRRRCGAEKITYFVLELNIGTLLGFALAPRLERD